MLTLFEVTPVASVSTAFNAYNHRFVVAPSGFAANATSVRVKFRRTTFDYTVRASIGLQSPTYDVYDIDPTTFVQLRQGGSLDIVVSAANPYSDTVDLAVDGTRSIVVAVFRNTTGSVAGNFTTGIPKPTALTIYGRNVATDETGAPNVTSYAANTAAAYCILALEGESEPVAVRSVLDQLWSIKTGATLDQPWGDSPITRAALYQPWGDAAVIRSILKQPWQDALAARATLVQPWAISVSARAMLDQPWAITAEGVRALLDQPWRIADVEPVRAVLDQPWSIAADDAVLRYVVTVTVGGKLMHPSSITIEGDLDEDALSCELQVESEAEYLHCRDGMDILVAIVSSAGSEQFKFVVTVLRITEKFGGAQFIVEGLSEAVLIGPPYSLGYSGPLEGLASSIATTLVPGVDWKTVDWEIPPGLWVAAGETRLELLKHIASVVGAVVQSDRDGSVRVQPEYLKAFNLLGTAAADAVMVEMLDCFTVGSTFDPRSGYNRYLVGDQATSGAKVTLDLSDVSPGVMEARVYEVPWTGELTLTHTGGDWAAIVDIGVEEREETDIVEFVGGAGRIRLPVYKVSAVTWLQADLGILTAAEDGSIAATIAGQSLARITYTTRCRLWKVVDGQPEKLQVVVEQ